MAHKLDEVEPRPDCPRADSFHLFSCDDPNCGPHLVAYDKDEMPICEMIVPRRLIRQFVAELEKHFPPRMH